MAITIPATGTGTAVPVVATDPISSTHYQQFKLIDSNPGSLTPLATSSNPLFAQFASPQSIVGSVQASVPNSFFALQANAPWIFTGSVYATGSVNATIQAGSVFASQAGSVPWSIVGSVQVAASSPFLMEGDTAQGSLDSQSSFPVAIGGFAVTSAWPTFVGSGARVKALFDRGGRMLVQPMAPVTMRINKNGAFTGPLSGTVIWSTTILGGRIIVTDFNVLAGSATSGIVGLYFARSGAPINITVGSGTVLFHGEMAPSTTVKPGAVKVYTYPEVGDPSDALRISLTTTMQVYVQVGGYEAP